MMLRVSSQEGGYTLILVPLLQADRGMIDGPVRQAAKMTGRVPLEEDSTLCLHYLPRPSSDSRGVPMVAETYHSVAGKPAKSLINGRPALPLSHVFLRGTLPHRRTYLFPSERSEREIMPK